MYDLYGSLKTRAFRVAWLLEELNQPYTLHPVMPGSPDLDDVNPARKVPVLVANGTPIADSMAIMTYLADVHGDLTYPAGTLDRARQDACSNLILDEFDAVLWTAARHTFVLPKDKRHPEVKPSLRWEFDRNLTRFMDRIEGDWVMGDRFTVADILLTQCLDWAQAANFDASGAKVTAYADRARARAGYQAVLAKT